MRKCGEVFGLNWRVKFELTVATDYYKSWNVPESPERLIDSCNLSACRCLVCLAVSPANELPFDCLGSAINRHQLLIVACLSTPPPIPFDGHNVPSPGGSLSGIYPDRVAASGIIKPLGV
jgi:hypothetical protein